MRSPVLPLVHGLAREQLETVCADLGQPTFRARQVWRWLYQERVWDWTQMRNLPASFRAELAGMLSLESAAPVETQGGGRVGSETKMLFRLRDGEHVEAVAIPARGRKTLCVSSQVGCRFHCAFCASGQAGFVRNLQAGEIVGQVVAASRAGGVAAEKPSHIVFMGIGEPLDNYEEVLAAIRIINDKDGLSIGARRITISTCGIVPAILMLKHEGLQVELSISLHAPDDDLRSSLMPVNRRYPLAAVLGACREYTGATGRIITFEYTLIHKINDSPKQAAELGRMLEGMKCRVNLIPLSPVAEFEGHPSSREAVSRFADVLRRLRVNTTIRASKGCALDAACGQLRHDHSGR